MSKLDSQTLATVFESRPDILEGIKRAADTPARISLFNEIAGFVYDQTSGSEPSAKRRRIEHAPANGHKTESLPLLPSKGAVTSGSAAEEAVELVIGEISVSVPQRKKYDICLTSGHLYARAPGTTAPVPGIVYAWADIEHLFYIPVPEKAQVQHNYVIFPRGTSLPSKTADPSSSNGEPLVFTVPATAPKQGTISGPQSGAASAVSDTYRALFDWALSHHLRAASNPVAIVATDPARFHSVARQPHRPSEKAVHVKAFRGSKDGYLFFLETGILWAFKKPLLFIPLERVAAISYTSVLQRTFNMVVEAFTGEGDATEEFEFAMLDQEDYQGIDETYVKRNRLQDRSMAEQRQAKLELLENIKAAKKAQQQDGGGGATEGATNGAAAGAAAAGAGMTELEKAHAEAEMQLQDDEDEDEEDYDPGSEGDSEGEGETSEEDDDDDDDAAMANGDDGEEEYDEEEEDETEGHGNVRAAG